MIYIYHIKTQQQSLSLLISSSLWDWIFSDFGINYSIVEVSS